MPTIRGRIKMNNRNLMILFVIGLLCVSSVVALKFNMGGKTFSVTPPEMPTTPVDKSTAPIPTVYADQLSTMQTKINKLEADKRDTNFRIESLLSTITFLQQDIQESQNTITAQNTLINQLKTDYEFLKKDICTFNKEYKACEGVKI